MWTGLNLTSRAGAGKWKKEDSFWSDVKRLNNPGVAQCSPVVDSVSGTTNIANIFASKFGALLNKHSSSQYSLLTSVQASLTVSHLSSVIVSEDDISDAKHTSLMLLALPLNT